MHLIGLLNQSDSARTENYVKQVARGHYPKLPDIIYLEKSGDSYLVYTTHALQDEIGDPVCRIKISNGNVTPFEEGNKYL